MPKRRGATDLALRRIMAISASVKIRMAATEMLIVRWASGASGPAAMECRRSEEIMRGNKGGTDCYGHEKEKL